MWFSACGTLLAAPACRASSRRQLQLKRLKRLPDPALAASVAGGESQLKHSNSSSSDATKGPSQYFIHSKRSCSLSYTTRHISCHGEQSNFIWQKSDATLYFSPFSQILSSSQNGGELLAIGNTSHKSLSGKQQRPWQSNFNLVSNRVDLWLDCFQQVLPQLFFFVSE